MKPQQNATQRLWQALEFLRSAYPQFEPDEGVAEAWKIVLEGIRPSEMLAAVTAYTRSSAVHPPTAGQIRTMALKARLPLMPETGAKILERALADPESPAGILARDCGVLRMTDLGTYYLPSRESDPQGWGFASKTVEARWRKIQGSPELWEEVQRFEELPSRSGAGMAGLGPGLSELMRGALDPEKLSPPANEGER